MQLRSLSLALTLSLLITTSGCKDSGSPTSTPLPLLSPSPSVTPSTLRSSSTPPSTLSLPGTPLSITRSTLPSTGVPSEPNPQAPVRPLLIPALSVPISQDQTQDPCLFDNPNTLAQPIIQEIQELPNSPYEFENRLERDPENTLKTWLLTTQTFAGAQFSDIQIQVLDGVRSSLNAGIYEVSSTQTGNLRFILKISIMAGEAEKLWKIQNSRIGHPECFQRTDLGLHHRASDEEITRFPRIPRLREATQFSIDPNRPRNGSIRQSRTHRFLILMERAPGVALASIPSEQPELLTRAYQSAGKSLGYLQYFMASHPSSNFMNWQTWRHGDLHANNLFFDDETQQVTFIDHADLAGNQDLQGYSYDFQQIALSPLNSAIHHNGNSRLHDLFRGPDVDLDLRFTFDQYITDESLMNLTDAPVDSAVLTTIQRSRAFQNVEARFHLYASFVRGYLEAMPQSQRDGIKIYFANELRAIVRHFINYSVRDENSHLVNLHELNPDLELNTRRSNRNLVRRLRSLFPASVLHCIDRSEF